MIRLGYVVMFLGAAACGGGDDNMVMPDAPAGPVYNYDLSCLNVTPSPVPATVHLEAYLAHITSRTDGAGFPYQPLRVESIDGTSMLASATTDQDGLFTIDITTGGTLTPVRLAWEPTNYAKQRWYGTRAPWRGKPADGDIGFFGAKRFRAMNIAAVYGQGIDNTKGTVEVWVTDCNAKPMPGATVALTEHPDAQWAMHDPIGNWVAGTKTIAPNMEYSEAMTATANVEPGMKTVTVTAGSQAIGTVQILVEADSYNRVFVIPGYASKGNGF